MADLGIADFWQFDEVIGAQVARAIGERLRDRLAPLRVYRSDMVDLYPQAYGPFGGFLIEVDPPMDRQEAERFAASLVTLVQEPIDEVGLSVEAVVGLTTRRIDGDANPVVRAAGRANELAKHRHISWVIEGEDGDGLRRIDEVDLKWRRHLQRGRERQILPDHPWVDRDPPRDSPEVVLGSAWTTCIDLIGEEDFDERGWLLRMLGARMTMRHLGRPLERDDVAGLHGYRESLALIPAGTALHLTSCQSWSDSQYDVGGWWITFALPDGRRFSVATEFWSHDPIGMTWDDLLVAAVVVPVDHPLARDEAALHETVALIEALATSASGARVPMIRAHR